MLCKGAATRGAGQRRGTCAASGPFDQLPDHTQHIATAMTLGPRTGHSVGIVTIGVAAVWLMSLEWLDASCITATCARCKSTSSRCQRRTSKPSLDGCPVEGGSLGGELHEVITTRQTRILTTGSPDPRGQPTTPQDHGHQRRHQRLR